MLAMMMNMMFGSLALIPRKERVRIRQKNWLYCVHFCVINYSLKFCNFCEQHTASISLYEEPMMDSWFVLCVCLRPPAGNQLLLCVASVEK